MFEKISSKRLQLILLFKYIYQLILAPLIIGLFINLIFFIVGTIRFDLNYMMNYLFGKSTILGIEIYGFILFIGLSYVISLVNVLSILPFFKLILDCILKKSEETKEIEYSNALPAYELQCFRESKRFVCDTFSRKKNVELFIYDEHKTKYRLFWNEKYGSKEKAEQIICDGKKLKISYFKHSKIIFRCDVLEYDNG